MKMYNDETLNSILYKKIKCLLYKIRNKKISWSYGCLPWEDFSITVRLLEQLYRNYPEAASHLTEQTRVHSTTEQAASHTYLSF